MRAAAAVMPPVRLSVTGMYSATQPDWVCVNEDGPEVSGWVADAIREAERKGVT